MEPHQSFAVVGEKDGGNIQGGSSFHHNYLFDKHFKLCRRWLLAWLHVCPGNYLKPQSSFIDTQSSNFFLQIFCFYTGTGIFFVYIFNLTFFGAFLAFFGELEAKGYHGLFFCISKDRLEVFEFVKNLILIFETLDNFKDPVERGPTVKGPISISQFVFDRWLPDMLVKKHVKIVIAVIFGAYLGLTLFWCIHTRSVYGKLLTLGILQLLFYSREGFERRKLARNDSTVVDFYNMEDAYFRWMILSCPVF